MQKVYTSHSIVSYVFKRIFSVIWLPNVVMQQGV